MAVDYAALLQHLKKYWYLAKKNFEEGDYPLAVFFAVTLIEEVGKVAAVNMGERMGTDVVGPEINQNHRLKYEFAVTWHLLVNSRVDRIYGQEANEFLKKVKDGTLFQMRNTALYMHVERYEVRLPSEKITRENAYLVVCFSGEVFAEAQNKSFGDTDSWLSLLKEVDDFRAYTAVIGGKIP